MISTDPFDTENKGVIYISAKRGLGIKVVEGQRIAEQVLFRPRSNSIKVLTRSAEDSLLTFDENGGVKEVPIDQIDRNPYQTRSRIAEEALNELAASIKASGVGPKTAASCMTASATPAMTCAAWAKRACSRC